MPAVLSSGGGPEGWRGCHGCLLTGPLQSDGGGGSHFKMHIFRSFAEEPRRDLLHGGLACTLLHTESECYVRGGADEAAPSMAPGVSHSNAIWQVLHEDDHDGAACRWEGRFRLRHVPTGRFLAAQQRHAGDPPTIALLDGSKADEAELLFSFEPQYTTTGVITTHHFLRVRHETFDNVPVYLMAERRGAVAAAGSEPPSPSPVGGKGGS